MVLPPRYAAPNLYRGRVLLPPRTAIAVHDRPGVPSGALQVVLEGLLAHLDRRLALAPRRRTTRGPLGVRREQLGHHRPTRSCPRPRPSAPPAALALARRRSRGPGSRSRSPSLPPGPPARLALAPPPGSPGDGPALPGPGAGRGQNPISRDGPGRWSRPRPRWPRPPGLPGWDRGPHQEHRLHDQAPPPAGWGWDGGPLDHRRPNPRRPLVVVWSPACRPRVRGPGARQARWDGHPGAPRPRPDPRLGRSSQET